MNTVLQTSIGNFEIIWDERSSINKQIKNHDGLEGIAHNIGGAVFFYTYALDIEFSGEEKSVFDKGDVVYWKSQTETGKFGILFMYGNTSYGDGTKPRTSSPGIKIGKIKEYQSLENIKTGALLKI